MSERRIVLVRPKRGLPGPGTVPPTLSELGYDVDIVEDGEFTAEGDAPVWIGGCANWYPGTWRRLLALTAARPPVVLWHSEPLPPPRASGLRLARLHVKEIAKILLRDPRTQDPRSNFRALRKLVRQGLPHVLVVSTRERQEFLAEHGIEASFVPLGYREDVHGRDLGLARDIDVLFLGSLDVPRRKRILAQLRRQGLAVQALGGWDESAFWGERRTRLLNRTKVLLNLPRHPGLLSGGRMILGMANKALVVAEPIYRPEPYRPGEHYVSAELDEMPEVAARFLADEDARTRITESAYAFVRTSLTATSSVKRILALVDAARR